MNRNVVWIVVMTLFAVSSHAQHVVDERDFRWETVGGGVSITGFTGTGAVVQIPPQIQGQPVVSIGTAAFLQRGLAVVIIPDTVTSIGPMAFASNELTSMNIPPSVTFIGQLAFADNRLSSVIIPTGVTSIGYRAFHCNQLLLVIIPDSVVSIGDDAFGDARLLRPDGTDVYIADFHPDAVPLQAGPVRRRNWFSTDFTFLGLGLRYERTINDLFSVGARVFVNWIGNTTDTQLTESEKRGVIWNHFPVGALATARFYPFGWPFFYLELGMGWGMIHWERRTTYYTFFEIFEDWGFSDEDFHQERHTYSGLMVAPAVGLRFGGRRWGFFINPFVSTPIVVDSADRIRATVVGGISVGSAW